MQRFRPLPSTNPEFSVLCSPTFCEYRVDNWHLACDGSGSIVRGTSCWSWRHSLSLLLLLFFWAKVAVSMRAFLILVSLSYLWAKCTQVIHESVIVLPPHGIQLETHWGYPPLTVSVSRRFIPRTVLQDVIINEGIKRWDIRYYLVALRREHPGRVTLEVFYQNVLPRFPVLLEVYRGIHRLLSIPPLARKDMR